MVNVVAEELGDVVSWEGARGKEERSALAVRRGLRENEVPVELSHVGKHSQTEPAAFDDFDEGAVLSLLETSRRPGVACKVVAL